MEFLFPYKPLTGIFLFFGGLKMSDLPNKITSSKVALDYLFLLYDFSNKMYRVSQKKV